MPVHREPRQDLKEAGLVPVPKDLPGERLRRRRLRPRRVIVAVPKPVVGLRAPAIQDHSTRSLVVEVSRRVQSLSIVAYSISTNPLQHRDGVLRGAHWASVDFVVRVEGADLVPDPKDLPGGRLHHRCQRPRRVIVAVPKPVVGLRAPAIQVHSTRSLVVEVSRRGQSLIIVYYYYCTCFL